jgi:PhnB protein
MARQRRSNFIGAPLAQRNCSDWMHPWGRLDTEIQIGDSRIMMTDDCGGESPFRNPNSSGGSPVGLHLYVEDVDIVFAQAVSAGATVIKPVQDQFYGDRTGALKDPFGHIWFLATH